MSENNKLQNWQHFLDFYSEANIGRPTRLGFFESGNDFWLEDGLCLQGIDLAAHGSTATIEIRLDGYTHRLKEVIEMKANFSTLSNNDGLDFTEQNGTTTILRFENW